MIEFQANAEDVHRLELPPPHATFEKSYYLATFLLPADSLCEEDGCESRAHVGLVHLSEGQEKVWYESQAPEVSVAMIVKCEPFCTNHVIDAAIKNQTGNK